MTCHNCLREIDPKKERYRKLDHPSMPRPIYIHWPGCPERSNSLAHYRNRVSAGKPVAY